MGSLLNMVSESSYFVGEFDLIFLSEKKRFCEDFANGVP